MKKSISIVERRTKSSMVLVFIIIAVVVLVIYVFGFTNFWGDGTSTIKAVNTQASSLSISICSGYCSVAKGDKASFSIVVSSAEVARYDYCRKPLKFVMDDNKEEMITCSVAAQRGYISKCDSIKCDNL